MACVTIPAENKRIEDVKAIRDYLAPHGIYYERWPVEGRIDPDSSSEAILAEFSGEVERLKKEGGYVTADVINVTPETPGLDLMLNKFNKEHTHSEDEVRFIIKGHGVFHVHPKNGPVFAIQVEGGDLINVPQGTQHWFDLCQNRNIKAIRLFKDKAGWAPQYVESGVHEGYMPICFGPAFVQVARPAVS
jgi:1,2-dihydroxy-3-keto-5-methylthiopentene dioxygenase